MTSTQLQPGTVIHGTHNDYRIERVLGQGSFGITYVANVRLKGRLGAIESTATVAIKEFFLRDVSSRNGLRVFSVSDSTLCSDYRRDFLREAQNLSRLDNDHIVKVLETIEENDTVYYVMEYLSGGNLDQHILSHGKLSCREALDIAIQIGEALKCMHAQHMLHLDLKPLNVMRGEDGHIVLIDFGLSKCFGADGQPESSTRIGQGTTGYAPIEQHSFKKADGFMPTLDIYALGATLFKMLTGSVPPEASVVLNEGLPVDELSSAGVPPAVIALVERAMQPLRRMRHQTVGEFVDEAQRLLASAPSSVGRPASPSADVPTPVGEAIRRSDGWSDIPKSVFAVRETIFPNDETTDREGAVKEDRPAKIEVRWERNLGEDTKQKLRSFLSGMKRRRVWNNHPYDDDGDKVEVFTLGDNSLAEAMDIINNRATDGYFPRLGLHTALRAVLLLEQMTGLSFRLASESELVFDRYDPDRKDLYLCFDGFKDGFYLIHEEQVTGVRFEGMEYITKINAYTHLFFDSYGMQIVCDGASPMCDGASFNLRATQMMHEEMQPIGNSFYRVRSGNQWNISSYFSPVMPLLPQWHDNISDFSVHTLPGPAFGLSYVGVKATDLSGYTYYYKWIGSNFELIAKYDKKEREEREQFT
ncbi:MAG: serine/threonine-protein kinase [Prevotella sp.]|nr:serine/threonine protein kinase [Prevotella sp.]MDY5089664.1 serine/threonine-protein kinase [Prevotella sp.]